MGQTSFHDDDGLEVMRADVVGPDHTAHHLALYHEGGAFGLYSPEDPLDRSLVLFRPHGPATHWVMRSREDICDPVEERAVTAEEGQAILDFWELARRVSMAGSVTE